MAKRAVLREPSVINPMFPIPEGVIELEYDDRAIDAEVDFEGDEVDVEVSVDYSDISEDYSDHPATPQIIGIIPPQVIRMGDSGTEVVDVIFEVEEVSGATTYEFRVTKA